MNRFDRSQKGEATTIDTPIVDLFWGQSEFGEHDCAAVAQSVMKSLDSRVSVEVGSSDMQF